MNVAGAREQAAAMNEVLVELEHITKMYRSTSNPVLASRDILQEGSTPRARRLNQSRRSPEV
ncbi:MAG: hypothetical protein H5U03_06690 [Clostridia bacterium]|nr:hypothetical protein [Clostridia bacterium]